MFARAGGQRANMKDARAENTEHEIANGSSDGETDEMSTGSTSGGPNSWAKTGFGKRFKGGSDWEAPKLIDPPGILRREGGTTMKQGLSHRSEMSLAAARCRRD